MPDVKNEVALAENTQITERSVKNGQLDYMSGDAMNKAYKNAAVLAKSE